MRTVAVYSRSHSKPVLAVSGACCGSWRSALGSTNRIDRRFFPKCQNGTPFFQAQEELPASTQKDD
jgi:hypothetical protein